MTKLQIRYAAGCLAAVALAVHLLFCTWSFGDYYSIYDVHGPHPATEIIGHRSGRLGFSDPVQSGATGHAFWGIASRLGPWPIGVLFGVLAPVCLLAVAGYLLLSPSRSSRIDLAEHDFRRIDDAD